MFHWILRIEMNTASMHHACALATWRSHNAACSHSSAHVGSSKATLTIQAVAWAMRINEVSSRRLIIFLICLLLLRAVLSIPGYSGLFSILSSICAVGPLWVSGRITQKLTRVGGRRVGPSGSAEGRASPCARLRVFQITVCVYIQLYIVLKNTGNSFTPGFFPPAVAAHAQQPRVA